MKTILNLNSLVLALSMLLASSVFSFNGNKESFNDDVIEVVANSATGNARINWKDSRIETIEIISSNGQFMPTIPVMGASELHLNDLINGTYTIVFKSNESILYTKTIEINR
jgi:maltose-binding protein MalE